MKCYHCNAGQTKWGPCHVCGATGTVGPGNLLTAISSLTTRLRTNNIKVITRTQLEADLATARRMLKEMGE